MEKKIYVSYFSPTGGTRRAAMMLGQALARQEADIIEVDLSLPKLPLQTFSESDVVIFAVPVFGGRAPALALQKISELAGSGARAIAVVAYGNRAYEDALLELSDHLTKMGFIVTAAAAVLAEHSMLRSVAAGRPDGNDQKQLTAFAEKIAAKLQTGIKALTDIPGNRPYKDWQAMPVVPQVGESCNGCGKCAATCPAQAIGPAQPQTTDPDKCILCLRCTVVCPQKARSLPPQAQSMIAQKLAPFKELYKNNEFFI